MIPGGGAFSKVVYGKVTLAAATATKVPTTATVGRNSVILLNVDSANMFIGGDTSVSDSTGFTLLPNASVELDVSDAAPVYAYSVAGGDVQYIEVRS